MNETMMEINSQVKAMMNVKICKNKEVIHPFNKILIPPNRHNLVTLSHNEGSLHVTLPVGLSVCGQFAFQLTDTMVLYTAAFLVAM